MQRVTLPSGREVIDTGKVRIGIRAQRNPPPTLGTHAEFLQRVLTAPEPPRQWHPTPKKFHVKPSLWQRLVRWWMDGGR